MNCKHLLRIASVWAVGLAIGCGAQVAGKVQQGRQSLKGLQPAVAVGYFREAVELDPDYVTIFILPVSARAYLGRAYYENGQYSEALQATEAALAKNQDDYLARLYLGLSLMRLGSKAAGLRELRNGLQGLLQWNEDISAGNLVTAKFWDRGRHIRSEIQKSLAMTSSGNPSEAELFRSVEWIGRTLDEEIDQVRQDEVREFNAMRDGR